MIEAVGAGYDKVFATADHTLAADSEVEWLEAAAGDAGVKLTGNDLANAIVGGAGNDTLDGAGGVDQLFGGAGADHFVFHLGEANGDRVVDFTAGDVLDLFGYGEGATLTQVGATDAWTITADAAHGGVTETITLTNVVGLNTTDYLFH